MIDGQSQRSMESGVRDAMGSGSTGRTAEGVLQPGAETSGAGGGERADSQRQYTPKTKQKRCKSCKLTFVPSRPLQVCCSPNCALCWGREQSAKAEARQVRAQRRETRAKLNAMKSLATLKAEAQAAFNKWIRWRDRGQPCISCGTRAGMDEPNGADAGHYRTRSAAPHLRYDERNVHAQCKRCNRYLAGNQAAMGRGMIQRIGLAAVEALDADNAVRKFTREELIAIRADYLAKLG